MASIWDHGSPTNLGGDHSPGWRALLEELNVELEAIDPNYTWVQIKQKFCELRVYLGKHNRILCGCSGYHDCRMEQAIARAGQRSIITCEICGNQAEPQSFGILSCFDCKMKQQAEREIRKIKNITTI